MKREAFDVVRIRIDENTLDQIHVLTMNEVKMSFVRIDGVKCESCGKLHCLAIALPAYPNTSYRFLCPETNTHMYLSGLMPEARVILTKVPEECVEAEAI